MGGGRATIYDIAEEAGVSIATVSRVLRGESSVSEKTKCNINLRQHSKLTLNLMESDGKWFLQS